MRLSPHCNRHIVLLSIIVLMCLSVNTAGSHLRMVTTSTSDLPEAQLENKKPSLIVTIGQEVVSPPSTSTYDSGESTTGEPTAKGRQLQDLAPSQSLALVFVAPIFILGFLYLALPCTPDF